MAGANSAVIVVGAIHLTLLDWGVRGVLPCELLIILRFLFFYASKLVFPHLDEFYLI